MLHSGEAKLIIGKRRWLTLDTVFNLNLYNEADVWHTHWTGHGIQECLKQLQSKNKDLGLLERLSKRERERELHCGLRRIIYRWYRRYG